jgi:hypothetical protein
VTPPEVNPIENPEQYREALIKAGVLTTAPETPAVPEEVKAQTELRDSRPPVRDSNGRVCRLNPDGTMDRVHFHQQLVTTWVDSKHLSYLDGSPRKVLNVQSFIHMPGEEWTDCKGSRYTLTERGEVRCLDVRIKGKGNKKRAIKERRLAREAQ